MDKKLKSKKMKRDININRTTISSEEILKGKNFEGLYQNFQANAGNVAAPKKAFYKSGWFIGGVASVVIAVVTTVMLTTNTPEENSSLTNQAGGLITDTLQANKTFICPPVEGIDVAYSSYIINADNGGKIKHFTGSEIDIPSMAFKNSNGDIVKGDVEIKYREFHDQADIFFSGIPMNYDSAGTNYFFESAGMIEIQAYQDGEKLEVADSKEIDVVMTTNNPDPKFNLYYLNEKDEKWDYIGKDSINYEQPDELPMSEDGMIEVVSDTNTYESPVSLALDEECLTKKEAVDKQQIIVNEIKQDIKKIENSKPIEPKKAKEDSYSFDIDVSPTEFPEMSEYTGMIFEAVDQKNFDADVYNVRWEDIELKKKNQKEFLVHLVKGKETKEILVFPVFEGKNYEQALATFNKQFDGYESKLEKRKTDEANAEKELAVKKKAFEEARAKLAEEAKVRRDKMMASQNAVSTSTLNMQRIFSITRFGTWNCDSPVKRPSGARVLAQYKNKKTGKNLDCINMNLVQRNMNAVFPLYNNDLTFSPERANVLWGVSIDGDIVIAFEDEFKHAKKASGKTYIFKMEVINPEGKSIEDIKNIIKA